MSDGAPRRREAEVTGLSLRVGPPRGYGGGVAQTTWLRLLTETVAVARRHRADGLAAEAAFFAVLSMPVVHDVTGARPVLLYRHPGAALVSFRRMGWNPGLAELGPIVDHLAMIAGQTF